MAIIIGIVSPKGGSGKTTTAVHLARSIQITGDSVAIIDTDRQGSGLAWSTKRDGDSLVEVIDGRKHFKSTVGRWNHMYEVLVIDGAAKIEERTGKIITESDVCLIPVQPTPLDAWGAEQVVGAIKQSDTAAAFLITQQKPQTNLASEVAKGLEEAYSLPVLDARLSHRVAFAESMLNGQTVLDVSGGRKAQEEVEALRTELIDFIQTHVE
jgi:chromosome partitioning protein